MAVVSVYLIWKTDDCAGRSGRWKDNTGIEYSGKAVKGRGLDSDMELEETNNIMQSNEIFSLAEEQGISRRTLENAKKKLNIRARRINNSWYWELDKSN